MSSVLIIAGQNAKRVSGGQVQWNNIQEAKVKYNLLIIIYIYGYVCLIRSCSKLSDTPTCICPNDDTYIKQTQ